MNISPTLRDLNRSILRVQWIVWGAMHLLLLNLLFVLSMQLKTKGAPVSGSDDILLKVLPFIALGEAILAFALRRFLKLWQPVEGEPVTPQLLDREASDPRTKAIRHPLREKLSTLSPSEFALFRQVKASTAPLVISWALHESIGILGFVLAFNHKDISLFYPYAATAILLNLWLRPRDPTKQL